MDSGNTLSDAASAPDSKSNKPQTADSKTDQLFDAPKKPAVKKRTKTGCYTCRRRRIKCDEGKPRCNNCIKSKRQCDGYNQRVIFKDPMGFQTNHLGPAAFPNNASHSFLVHHHASLAAQNARAASSQGSLTYIAPRPPINDDIHPIQHHLHTSGFPSHPGHPGHPGHRHGQLPIPGPPQYRERLFAVPETHLNPSFVPFAPPDRQLQLVPTWESPHDAPSGGSLLAEADVFALANSYREPSFIDAAAATATDIFADIPTASFVGRPGHAAETGTVNQELTLTREYLEARYEEGDALEHPSGLTVFAENDAYWYPDDDASMDESEDEEFVDDMEHLKTNHLGAVVAQRLHNRPFDTFGIQIRTFSNFADVDVLSTYVPLSSNSPLTHGPTAAVFWYFVNVTGPIMSLFERHPIDPSPIFEGQPVPRSRQHIWTYTFPIIALNHPALLQAMLALGSLQMAKLQGIPATASMKHYHLSLRRVARNYQSVTRRVQPATLAATMLLGFYEVWNSDHDKWCKHMWGARAIFREIPLEEWTRKIVAIKKKQRQEQQQNILFGNDPYSGSSSTLSEKDIDQVDTQFVAQLAGRPVSYEDDQASPTHSSGFTGNWKTPNHCTEKDIETYELLSDVFWWYCKMDVYQSILGGTALLMEYQHWTQCSPRAPIGKIDAVYGSYDHLMILVGRVCDFSYRDQARKRKARRPDGSPGGGPPGQSQDQSPPFVGMMPSTGHVTIPNGFSPPREESPQSDSQEEIDFETSTATALREWEELKDTFETYRVQLGSDYDPLGPEYETPAASPFGLVLKYRTYSIAAVWLHFYMGLIVLYRAHPSMPPIAMVAAAMVARQTAPWANQIGRIAAGITSEDLSSLTNVSTLLGAASIECSFPLFVAGVQLQDLTQRHWLIRRLHNIARLTGWQSARQIAIGCETVWNKAASTGRGPPYESPFDVEVIPPSIWNRPRRFSDRIRELEDDDEKLVLSSTERSQYAIGLLSMETDLEKLELADKE